MTPESSPAKAEVKAPEVTPKAPEPTKDPFTIVGAPPGPFNVRGASFGSTRGSVSIGGHICPISGWRDDVIKGVLPVGVKGEVIVTTSNGVLKGTFPQKS